MSHYTNCNTVQSIQVILWGDSFVLSFWNYLIRNASAGQWTGMGMNLYGWIWVLFGFQQYTKHSHTQTEVCFVLTGWWSGAPVRGLHPEGEPQVLPGCRGAGQSPVLPGAHIWGKGRHSNSTVLTLFEPNTKKTRDSGVGCLCSAPWSKSLFFFCSYIITYSAVLRKGTGRKDALTQPRTPWKPGIHMIHLCLGPDSAQRVIKAEQTSTEFSWWAFLARAQGQMIIPWDDTPGCVWWIVS